MLRTAGPLVPAALLLFPFGCGDAGDTSEISDPSLAKTGAELVIQNNTAPEAVGRQRHLDCL